MKDNHILFFELIRVSIGRQECLYREPSKDEWVYLYNESERQALTALCFAGVRNLMKYNQNPPEELYFQWLGETARVMERNTKLNLRTTQCFETASKAGFSPIILKGQGLEHIYPQAIKSLRQPGDIDIWLRGERNDIVRWVNSIAPTKDVDLHHIRLRMYDDVEVEAHFKPTYLCNPIHNRRINKKLKELADDRRVSIDEGELRFDTPDSHFNALFVLVHIYRHLFSEGIGLRQVMDYYYVILNWKMSEREKDELMADLKRNGLYSFAAGIMWVLGTVFGMKREEMIVSPNKEVGSLILSDILRGGNFGHFDDRKKGKETKIGRFITANTKNLKYLRYFPAETLFTPLYWITQFMWKKLKGYE